MERSTKYHILIFLVALIVVSLGGWYRSKLKQKDLRIHQQKESLNAALLSEVEQLKLAFQETELEAIEKNINDTASQTVPLVVSIVSVNSQTLVPNLFNEMGRNADSFQFPDSVSGILIDKEGYILTSSVSVKNGKNLLITLGDRSQRSADVISVNQHLNLALLKLRKSPGVFYEPKVSSRKPHTGEWLLHLGRTTAGEKIICLGMVSLTHQDKPAAELFVLDSKTIPELDGGPVIDLNGDIVGINLHSSLNSEIRNVCIPISNALQLAEQLKKRPAEDRKSWIGIEIQELDSAMKRYFMLEYGAIVTRIIPDSPAAKAGLLPGDVIVSINDREMKSPSMTLTEIGNYSEGTPLNLLIQRKGMDKKINMKSGAFEQQSSSNLLSGVELVPDESGIQISEVLPDTKAFHAGIHSADWILEIDNVPVNNGKQLRMKLETLMDKPQLWKVRRGTKIFYAVVG